MTYSIEWEMNREKSENDFHFYSIPPLPLPSGERGRVRGYNLKCSKYSSACLIVTRIRRRT
jgi:hypothetical protein